MTFTIDASEVMDFSGVMQRSAAITTRELVTTTNALAATGVGIAQEYAPVGDSGFLRSKIGIVQQATGGSTIQAAYGIRGVIYARIREFGGTITGNPWLVFKTRSGNWVKVRQVTQKGTRYMGRSVETLRPQARAAYAGALQRILAQMGGA